MEKETSIKWLFKQLWEEPKDKLTWNTILSKAEEIHKSQIEDAHNSGYYSGYMDDGVSPEQYYNQTFKKD
jgi:hypothetical protein